MSDDEEYVTLTEALEWEKRVRAPTTEDERVTALENALHVVDEAAAGWDGLEYESNMGRALLDAVRLIREHEWHWFEDDDTYGWDCQTCARSLMVPSGAPSNPDEFPKPSNLLHAEACEVGSWVRAAARAGL